MKPKNQANQEGKALVDADGLLVGFMLTPKEAEQGPQIGSFEIVKGEDQRLINFKVPRNLKAARLPDFVAKAVRAEKRARPRRQRKTKRALG